MKLPEVKIEAVQYNSPNLFNNEGYGRLANSLGNLGDAKFRESMYEKEKGGDALQWARLGLQTVEMANGLLNQYNEKKSQNYQTAINANAESKALAIENGTIIDHADFKAQLSERENDLYALGYTKQGDTWLNKEKVVVKNWSEFGEVGKDVFLDWTDTVLHYGVEDDTGYFLNPGAEQRDKLMASGLKAKHLTGTQTQQVVEYLGNMADGAMKEGKHNEFIDILMKDPSIAKILDRKVGINGKAYSGLELLSPKLSPLLQKQIDETASGALRDFGELVKAGVDKLNSQQKDLFDSIDKSAIETADLIVGSFSINNERDAVALAGIKDDLRATIKNDILSGKNDTVLKYKDLFPGAGERIESYLSKQKEAAKQKLMLQQGHGYKDKLMEYGFNEEQANLYMATKKGSLSLDDISKALNEPEKYFDIDKMKKDISKDVSENGIPENFNPDINYDSMKTRQKAYEEHLLSSKLEKIKGLASLSGNKEKFLSDKDNEHQAKLQDLIRTNPEKIKEYLDGRTDPNLEFENNQNLADTEKLKLYEQLTGEFESKRRSAKEKELYAYTESQPDQKVIDEALKFEDESVGKMDELEKVFTNEVSILNVGDVNKNREEIARQQKALDELKEQASLKDMSPEEAADYMAKKLGVTSSLITSMYAENIRQTRSRVVANEIIEKAPHLLDNIYATGTGENQVFSIIGEGLESDYIIHFGANGSQQLTDGDMKKLGESREAYKANANQLKDSVIELNRIQEAFVKTHYDSDANKALIESAWKKMKSSKSDEDLQKVVNLLKVQNPELVNGLVKAMDHYRRRLPGHQLIGAAFDGALADKPYVPTGGTSLPKDKPVEPTVFNLKEQTGTIATTSIAQNMLYLNWVLLNKGNNDAMDAYDRNHFAGTMVPNISADLSTHIADRLFSVDKTGITTWKKQQMDAISKLTGPTREAKEKQIESVQKIFEDAIYNIDRDGGRENLAFLKNVIEARLTVNPESRDNGMIISDMPQNILSEIARRTEIQAKITEAKSASVASGSKTKFGTYLGNNLYAAADKLPYLTGDDIEIYYKQMQNDKDAPDAYRSMLKSGKLSGLTTEGYYLDPPGTDIMYAIDHGVYVEATPFYVKDKDGKQKLDRYVKGRKIYVGDSNYGLLQKSFPNTATQDEKDAWNTSAYGEHTTVPSDGKGIKATPKSSLQSLKGN